MCDAHHTPSAGGMKMSVRADPVDGVTVQGDARRTTWNYSSERPLLMAARLTAAGVRTSSTSP